MGLKGKLVSKTSIKPDGDLFYKLYKEPHRLSNICPDKVHSVDLHSGEWGVVGSVIVWNFVLGGEKKVAKEIIEAIDEKKKSITFKVIGGDLEAAYKSFKFIVDVEKKGKDNLITLTLEYEKKTENVPDPCALMDTCVSIIKDIERHYLLVPN